MSFLSGALSRSLNFWGNDGMVAFPIVAGIAARVLPIPATSASVEQLFSVAGRVVTTARARLNSRHVNELCCLHQWLIDEGMVTESAMKGKLNRDLKMMMTRMMMTRMTTTSKITRTI